MNYQHADIASAAETLQAQFETLDDKAAIMRAPELGALYAQIRTLPNEVKSSFGKELNELKNELQAKVDAMADAEVELPSIDVTAPMDVNASLPGLLAAEAGSLHPLSQETNHISDIFSRMGFVTEESREIDDQYHMFESLNFPKGHPARDDYDTFMTVETDADGDPFIAPAHTSTMQNRTLRKYRDDLAKGEAIAAIVPDRCFRNEDLDARHEHTFYQVEGVYVAKGVHAGMLIATLQEFLQEYYGQQLDVRVNPFYFPFTEPSFEFALSCPFCKGKDAGCKVCSGEGWIELLGCGMIHPNVLRAADIDPAEYTGFAFGCGIDRLVMMKYAIEDIRHLESAKLDFLEQFA
ncbi:phenylalanine--tRNA ligase subunit alpha [Candidatus Saccharibacteria bacterium]|nr:MAG: phenylalanine--tRNA ligase subunit alpha [Candidatus Saccharibacteria bacterium]